MTDEPRDELDRALASRLDALAGGNDDAVAMLETMRPRLQRARTRHRMVRASAAALALAVVVSLVAVVSSASTRHGKVAVQSASSTSVQPVVPKPKPKPRPRTVTTTTTKPGAPAATTPGGTQAPTVPAPGTPPAGNSGPGSGSDGPGAGGTPTPSGSPQTHTYSAPGGSMTVECASGGLRLVSYAANNTWTPQVQTDKPQEIEVRFSRSGSGIRGGGHDSGVSDNGQSRIDVRLEGSCAQLRVETQ
jgi:hypothetical protein